MKLKDAYDWLDAETIQWLAKCFLQYLILAKFHWVLRSRDNPPKLKVVSPNTFYKYYPHQSYTLLEKQLYDTPY
jgi:hypothetical protein